MDFRILRERLYGVLLQTSPFALYGVTLGVLLALTSSWYFFCIVPLKQTIIASSLQIQPLQKKKLTAEKKIKNKDDLAQRVAELETFLDVKRELNCSDIQSQKEIIAKLLSRCFIKMHGCIPGKKEVYRNYATMPFCYDLSGSYESIVHFFTALRALNPIPVCRNLLIKRAPAGITCSATLLFFVRS